MATITPTVTRAKDGSWIRYLYETMGNADQGAPIPEAYAAWVDRSMQVTGTFGSATVVFQGSNMATAESPTYATMTDPLGNAVSFTAAGFKQISEAHLIGRPSTSGGTGTDVDVYILIRRPTDMRQ